MTQTGVVLESFLNFLTFLCVWAGNRIDETHSRKVNLARVMFKLQAFNFLFHIETVVRVATLLFNSYQI